MSKQTNKPKNDGLWFCPKCLLHKDEWEISFSYKLKSLHCAGVRRQGYKKLQYDEQKLHDLRCVLGLIVHTAKVGEEIKGHLFHP